MRLVSRADGDISENVHLKRPLVPEGLLSSIQKPGRAVLSGDECNVYIAWHALFIWIIAASLGSPYK